MLNCVYRLVAPRTFEPVRLEVDPAGCVLVRPTHLSICNADQRYFQGRRSAEVMAKKLPMALIHEGIGRVLRDPSGTFSPGQRVVMLPNNPHEENPFIGENYLRTSEFCGSGFDGFMQEIAVLPPSRVLALPDCVPDEIAAFTEMVSVAVHAVSRFDAIAHAGRTRIGVWGDGNLGFLVALAVRTSMPSARIFVVGRSTYKLADFTFADEALLSSEVGPDFSVDHAFECCGGEGSAAAIDQIIDRIEPEGTISLLGVSENPVPVNTRMVLEKGLRLFGSSRSGREDFRQAVQLYQDHPRALGYLANLVGSVVEVSTVAQATQAFAIDMRKSMGKTIMRWCV